MSKEINNPLEALRALAKRIDPSINNWLAHEILGDKHFWKCIFCEARFRYYTHAEISFSPSAFCTAEDINDHGIEHLRERGLMVIL